MMRAMYYAKLDYIKTKQQIFWMILVIPVVLLFMLRQEGGPVSMVIFCYALFMGLVFSTTAFGSCQHQENGFLLLLPATTGDRILGRFLYGLSFMGIAVLVGGLGMYLNEKIRGNMIVAKVVVPVCMAAFAVSLILMVIEYVFLYLFGEQQSANVLSLVRMIPGFVFFFGSMGVMNGIQEDPEQFVVWMGDIDRYLAVLGWCSLAVSLVIFAASVILCTAVTKKRDFG